MAGRLESQEIPGAYEGKLAGGKPAARAKEAKLYFPNSNPGCIFRTVTPFHLHGRLQDEGPSSLASDKEEAGARNFEENFSR